MNGFFCPGFVFSSFFRFLFFHFLLFHNKESNFHFPVIKRILANTASTSPSRGNNSGVASHSSRTAGLQLSEHQGPPTTYALSLCIHHPRIYFNHRERTPLLPYFYPTLFMYLVYVLHNYKTRSFFLISKIKGKRRWVNSSIYQAFITIQRIISSDFGAQ